MGQYYLIVNLDKNQFLHPHQCGDGLKLLEFGCSANGTLTALAILLADGNNRGGGDLHSDLPIIGSWAGDRIVIAGDYADEDKFTTDPSRNLYHVAEEEFEDISRQALRAMADDGYLAEEMKKNTTWQGKHSQSVYDYAMGVVPLQFVKKPIVIEVRGGIVQEVLNVPPGYEYEVVDFDNIETDGGAV